MKVYLDPASDILYASFYIQGLFDVFGKECVRFKSKYFKKFKHTNHFFAFVLVNEEGVEKKIVIDFTDSALIDLQALEWCHVYGKINFDGTNKSEKIRVIGPSFGIQIYSAFKTFRYAVTNLLKAFSRIPNKRRFLSDYKAQFKRPKLSEYRNIGKKDNYVFFMASLWKQETQTNNYRANFIRACKSNPHIDFEGGFAPRAKNDIQSYEELTTTSRVKMAEYLKNILKSMIVFNTPAVKSCHGWKLAEYLGMGSVIISTPLARRLPAPLLDSQHLLYSDGSMLDIQSKLDLVIKNNDLRSKLEKNALEYFNNYLQPKKVIESLISNVREE